MQEYGVTKAGSKGKKKEVEATEQKIRGKTDDVKKLMECHGRD